MRAPSNIVIFIPPSTAPSPASPTGRPPRFIATFAGDCLPRIGRAMPRQAEISANGSDAAEWQNVGRIGARRAARKRGVTGVIRRFAGDEWRIAMEPKVADYAHRAARSAARW